MRATFAAVVLTVAACVFFASAIRVPELDHYFGGYNGTGLLCGASSNDTKTSFVTFLSDTTHSYIVIAQGTVGGQYPDPTLSSTDAQTISAANVIQARIDSYNATTGYVSFTDTWKLKNNALGCLRMVADPAKKRHGGAHAVMFHLSPNAGACTGDINQLPDTPFASCGSSAPRFFEMTLRSAPCTSASCMSLLGEYTGVVTVRALDCNASPYQLSPSFFKAYNVSGSVQAFAFVKGPISASFDQPIPMIIRSYDSNTGQMRLQSFYSTRQCITLDATRLAQGAFVASVPTGGSAEFF